MAKKDNENKIIATDILSLVGGKENVSTIAHCMTRLRLTLKDESKVEAIIEALSKENIEARRVWNPMHRQPIFKRYKYFTASKDTDVSGDLFDRGVCLPSDTKMTDEDLQRVIDIIKGLM